jgi:GT2 family glycosyltransferase
MISAVFVSYRSAALAARAIATFQEDARRSGLEAEAIAVVNSEDPAERDALEPVADSVLFPPRNLGFAGGLNAGIAASRGGTLLLSNPDLLFGPGSVAALAGAAGGDGLVAAGPALYADGARTVLLSRGGRCRSNPSGASASSGATPGAPRPRPNAPRRGGRPS